MFAVNHYQYQGSARYFPLRFVRRYLLKGEKYRCNICGHNFSRFLPYGYVKRENAMCPGCGAIESSRTLWFYLTNEVLGKKNKNKFLYFAPEKSILNHLKNYTIDLDVLDFSYLAELGSVNFAVKQGGIYDVIIFSHLLEYVNDDILVLSELKRLLRPGGFIILQTIINVAMDRTYEHIETPVDRERLMNFYEPGVKSIYGANFHKHLSKAGFNVELVDFADCLGTAAKAYYQLGNGERELILKCKKN